MVFIPSLSKMLIICNFKSKKMIIILCICLFILTLFLLTNNVFKANFLAKFNLDNQFSSIFVRLWSIEHSFGLFLQSPLLGSSMGTSAATSGLVVFMTSVGLIGLYLFIKISNLNKVVKFLFKKKQNKELFILSNFIISILICNIIAGDITTLMVWQKGVIDFFGFFQIFIPSVVNYIVPAAIMYFAVPDQQPAAVSDNVVIKKGGIPVVFLFLGTIAFTVSGHQFFHIPPTFGMMTGLGVLGFFSFFLKSSEVSFAYPPSVSLTEASVQNRLSFHSVMFHAPTNL